MTERLPGSRQAPVAHAQAMAVRPDHFVDQGRYRCLRTGHWHRL